MIGIGVRGVGVAGGLSLTARAISTLRRLNATLIGLPDDYGLVLGSDRFVNFNAAAGYVVSGTTLVCNAAAYSTSNITLSDSWEAGAAYRVTAVVSAFTSGSFYIQVGGAGATQYTTPVTAVGTYSSLLVANSAQTFANIQAIASGFVGTISSLRIEKIISAQHFIDSTGTQPVTAIGDLVGLTLDRMGTVGANFAPSTSTTTGWVNAGTSTLSTVGGALRVASNSTGVASARVADNTFSGFTVGRSYRLSGFISTQGGTASSGATPSISARDGSTTLGSASAATTSGGAPVTFVFVATNTTLYIRLRWDSTIAVDLTSYFDFSQLVLTELTGNHATQATTASKPTVTRVPKRLGPNLVVNGGFDSDTAWTKGTGWTISGGNAIHSGAAGAIEQHIGLVTGKTYQATYTSASSVGVINVAFGGTYVTGTTAVGINTAVGVAGSFAGGTLFQLQGGANYAIDNISVQEVLEWSNALDFDGSNDLLTISGPTLTSQATIIFAGVVANLASFPVVFGQGGASGGIQVLLNANGQVTVSKTAAAGQDVNSSVGAVPGNVPFVLSVVAVAGGTTRIFVNGVQVGSGTQITSSFSATSGAIGSNNSGGGFLNANVSDFCVAAVAMTDNDRKTIERAFAQKAGVTL